MYIYIFIYIYIWTQKKLIYKVYTSIHIQFSMGCALPQRKEGQGSDKSLHRVPYCSWKRVSQRSVLLESTELVIWLLQWEAALSFGSDDGASTQPRRKFYLVLFFFFKYMYLQCGWTAVVNQLLHIKKRKMALPSLVHLPALGVSTGRTGSETSTWNQNEEAKK